MSEFWVSKKKYFCKYCDIYIADDAPSRQQHENGLRHKGNKDRFIRELYKSGEKKKKDKEQEDREMKMVEQAAQAAYAKDVGPAAAEAAIASSSKTTPAAEKPKPRSGDKWANYTTAASLGIVDIEGEAAAAEAALRQNEGRVGEWATVAAPPPASVDTYDPSAAWVLPTSTSKSEREATPDAEEDTRRYMMKQKTVAVGLGADLYDPGVIKVKKRNINGVVKQEEQSVPATTVPEWRPIQLTRPSTHPGGAAPEAEDGAESRSTSLSGSVVKPEEVVGELSAESSSPQPGDETKHDITSSVIAEPLEETLRLPMIDEKTSTGGGSLFKKRKIKSSTAGGRRAQ
ncbi:hypothetical protein FRB96_005103 [Tulasnella sp. 330]|nr:hypothetical protein FRB96_005103 [Tulasnella sp. 330]KAG8881474.1 hypothetical protein FRB97_009528 [Tulasnella sp. 331]